MSPHALAVIVVVALWWLSTGIVLKAVWLGRGASKISVGLFTVGAAAGLAGLYWTSGIASARGAYAAFACSLLVWAWHELTFLLGIITGPRKVECPDDARGWRRFRLATAAVIHHEIALALTVAVVACLTWGRPNQIGTSTFLVLWIMRLSAKLNVFLGVRNVTEQFVPAHLRYMLSYFKRARMNPLMPFSLVAASAVAVRLGIDSFADGDGLMVTGRSIVAALLALAVIEHVFLTLPLPDALLWRWVIRKQQAQATR